MRNIVTIPDILYEMPSKQWFKERFEGYNVKIAKKRCKKVIIRTLLSEAQNHRCAICFVLTNTKINSRRQSTIEHVVPQSRGGTDNFNNLVMTCARCNNNRGSKFITEEIYAEV